MVDLIKSICSHEALTLALVGTLRAVLGHARCTKLLFLAANDEDEKKAHIQEECYVMI